jgi:1-acyl-sn-glycerol-3-phosphate acyltransferase
MTALSPSTAAIRLRSAIFLVCSVLVTLAFLPLMVLLAAPRRMGWKVLRGYVGAQLWLLRRICGVRYRVSGAGHLPEGPCLLAVRHESLWETLFLPWYLGNPAVVLKREILHYPLAGPVARKMGYIGVDRSGDLAAARVTFAEARRAAAAGRRVLIFPSGTRRPGLRDRVQPGVAVLYRQLEAPCVPITHNSADCWPHRSWLRPPGVIEVRILPPIPPGLKTREVMQRLERDLGPEMRPEPNGGS